MAFRLTSRFSPDRGPRSSGLQVAAVGIAALMASAGLTGAASAPPARSAGMALVSDPASLVDPFVGTTGNGNQSPGAHVPFGMVTWGPDTPHGGKGGGYSYADSTIDGFSLTHLSGVGCFAAGEVPVLPTLGAVKPGASVSFSHKNEQASASSYSVRLGNGVRTGLTATPRTGLAQFTFPATGQANLIFKLGGDGSFGAAKVSAASFSVVSPTEVRGTVTSGDFCNSENRYTVHFDMQFSQPMTGHGTFDASHIQPGSSRLAVVGTPGPRPAPVPPTAPEQPGQPVFHGTPDVPPYPVLGRPAGGWVTFDTKSSRTVLAKVGVSYVSIADARGNLAAEDPGWNFATIASQASTAWNNLLGRIQVSANPGGAGLWQRTFYTALYRALSYPNVFSDVNGQYLGMDRQIHSVPSGHDFYTNFSGWDIYRTQAQLMALLDPPAASDAAQSMVDDFAQGGELPKWVENNTETHIMVGDPADAILADYYAFGATGFDSATALADMVHQATFATLNRPGLNYLTNPGYLPLNGRYCGGCNYYAPVSATLEYGVADFATSQLASALGDTADAQRFLTRAQNWRSVFNPRAGLLETRGSDGSWAAGSSPGTHAPGFAEGDSWQYTGMVPYNIAGLIAAKGGAASMRAYLNKVLSGFLGGIHSIASNMTNEPSIELPWEYDYAGDPAQTQAKVRDVETQLYRLTPGGLAGNDDLGTMSAWFVWSALGMYPMTPGTSVLALGSPLFSQAVVDLGSGSTLTVDASPSLGDGTTRGSPYVQSATWDPAGGTAGAWNNSFAPASAITSGGTLTYALGSSPASWAAGAPPPSFPAPGSDPPVSVGTIVSASTANLCVDDHRSGTANGNKIDAFVCNGTGAQQWTARPDGSVRVFGKCLAPAGDHASPGTPVVLSSCDGSAAQQWHPGSAGALLDAASQNCLTDPGSATVSGTGLEVASCDGRSGQQWVIPSPGRPPAAGTIQTGAGKCVDDFHSFTTPGNKVDIFTCNRTSAQRWLIESDGTVHSALGGCLDVSHSGVANGTPIDYFPCNNTGAQQWHGGPSGALVNPRSGKCLTDPNATAADGTQLILSSCGGTGQEWHLP